jgi:hypothetical protein
MIKTQKVSERLGVAIVLSQRILEPIFLSKQNLRPLGIVFPSEDPALHVLCFDDKDPKRRKENVVDLRRSVNSWDHKVMNLPVNIRVQKHQHAETGCLLANPPSKRCAEAHMWKQAAPSKPRSHWLPCYRK